MAETYCPACGTQMRCKVENLPIGADGFSPLMSTLLDGYEVDLYACPKCGKVELFTANFRARE